MVRQKLSWLNKHIKKERKKESKKERKWEPSPNVKDENKNLGKCLTSKSYKLSKLCNKIFVS